MHAKYCSRCGRPACRANCGTLEFFTEIVTLWPFESAQGKIITGMKRNGSLRDKIIFHQELLPILIEQIRLSVCKHLARRIVFAPISSSSWKDFPMQNCAHPNLIAAQRLAKCLKAKNEPMNGLLRQVLCGWQNSPSVSMQRAANKRSQSVHADFTQWGTAWQQPAHFATLNLSHLHNDELPKIGSTDQHKETVVLFDDVLSSGYTAARTAAATDPGASCNWVLISALRTLKDPLAAEQNHAPP